MQLFEVLLEHFKARGLLKARGRQRTGSAHVLAAVRVLNRLARVGETLRHTLNTLAEVAPEWLRVHAPSEWYERFGSRMENYRFPKAESAREALRATMGEDGFALFRLLDAETALPWLREFPAVKTLRQVWPEQYADLPDPVRWREKKVLGSSLDLITSPYDPEACAGYLVRNRPARFWLDRPNVCSLLNRAS